MLLHYSSSDIADSANYLELAANCIVLRAIRVRIEILQREHSLR